MTEMKPANLGDFGVADYLAERISVPNKSVKDCSEESRNNLTGLSSKWQKMVAPHLYGSSPLLPNLRSQWYSKEIGSFSHKCQPMNDRNRQSFVYRLIFDSDKLHL